MKKEPKSCDESAQSVFFAKLNESFQTGPKRRKEEKKWKASTNKRFEIWYMLVVSLKIDLIIDSS